MKIKSEPKDIIRRRVARKHWEIEEIIKLMMLYKIFGSRWSIITQEFPSMTEIDVKNKFYSSLNSVATRLNDKSSTFPKSKDDLIKFVDIIIMHKELLPEKRGRRKSRLKRRRRKGSNSETNKIRQDKVNAPSIWLSNSSNMSKIFARGMSDMIWKKNEEDTNITNKNKQYLFINVIRKKLLVI